MSTLISNSSRKEQRRWATQPRWSCLILQVALPKARTTALTGCYSIGTPDNFKINQLTTSSSKRSLKVGVSVISHLPPSRTSYVVFPTPITTYLITTLHMLLTLLTYLTVKFSDSFHFFDEFRHEEIPGAHRPGVWVDAGCSLLS